MAIKFNRRTKLFLTVILGLPAILLFQNCGRTSFSEQSSTGSSQAASACVAVTCGDNVDTKKFYSEVTNKAFARGRLHSVIK